MALLYVFLGHILRGGPDFENHNSLWPTFRCLRCCGRCWPQFLDWHNRKSRNYEVPCKHMTMNGTLGHCDTHHKQVRWHLKFCHESPWRHKNLMVTSYCQANFKMQYLFFVYQKVGYTRFCIVWCLHWLSSAIGRLVMVEIASESLQWLSQFFRDRQASEHRPCKFPKIFFLCAAW